MPSVIRYTVARCTLSQAWAPPWFVFLLLIVILYAPGSPAVSSLTIGAVLLLPVSVWICLATLGSESEPQRATMAAAHGGSIGYRIGLLTSSLLAGLALVPFSIGWAFIRNAGPLSAPGIIASMLADVVAVALGTAIASCLARPFITRAGFSLLAAITVVVFLIAVPHLPPLRLLVEILAAGQVSPGDLFACGSITLATLAGTAGIWWATAVLARR